jgi:hypothetical protein
MNFLVDMKRSKNEANNMRNTTALLQQQLLCEIVVAGIVVVMVNAPYFTFWK